MQKTILKEVIKMHFYNHNKLAVTFNLVLLAFAIFLTAKSSINQAAFAICNVTWVLTFLSISMHIAYALWLNIYVWRLHKEGKSRHSISRRLANVEINHTFSLLNLHMYFRSMDSFEETAITEYFRTVRLKNWNLMSTKESLLLNK